ncbi:MAG: prepilin-type N-terminal cleavage/methylation domain-containing protein [Candidatus Omnitrophica bacterium]|nr:prepilin-type N-terminal cleavage/methylation domain-containing protein [Candidatus Omnitrophota bacterium]
MKKKGFSLLELIVTLVLIAIVSGIAGTGWRHYVDKERQDNAKSSLKLLWQAEESYFAWKNAYTTDWNSLAIEDPGKTDKFYTFKVERAEARSLVISATRKGTNSGFKIDQDGTITQF